MTRRRVAAWCAWLAVVFVVYELGLPHDRERAVAAAYDRGDSPGIVETARAYVTNDGDARRYFAYCNALLGRPYESYFVRSVAAWRDAFAVHEDIPPEALPIRDDGPLMPYRDFLVEYPPAFFAFALPPALVAHDLRTYLLAFGATMALCLTAALALCLRAARAFAGATVIDTRVVAWSAVAAIALGVVTTHRFDAAVSLAACACLWAATARRPALLGAFGALAIATKLVPALFVPIWLVPLARERKWRDVAIATAAGAVVLAVFAVPALVVAGENLVETVRYHADRPLQIESTWAGLLGIGRALGATTLDSVWSYGSRNVDGPLVAAASTIANLATIGGALAIYVATWRRLGRASDHAARMRVALAGACAVAAIAIACGKVTSPQYLVWLVPIGVLASIVDGRRRSIALFVGALVATQLVYPIAYDATVGLAWWKCTLIAARGVALVAWAIELVTGAP